jgi:hypothetical protein
MLFGAETITFIVNMAPTLDDDGEFNECFVIINIP